MKKTLLLTAIMATMVTSAAFAAVVPVTDIQAGQSKVTAEYSFNRHVTGAGSSNDGFGVGLETGLTDRWAVQYGYDKTNLGKHYNDLNTHEISAVYKLNDNFNLYGSGTMLDAGPNNYGLQAGVIGHKKLGEKVNGFAKVGFGDDIRNTVQVGASYALRNNLDLNAYYGYDKYDINDSKATNKGIHVGAGYKF